LHHGTSFLEYLDFIEAIREGKLPAATTEDGLLSVIVGLAAQESIETGQPVYIKSLIQEKGQ